MQQMDTGMLRCFESSKTHLGLHGALKTGRIVAANPALFQQFDAPHFLANSLPFVQLDRRMDGSHVLLSGTYFTYNVIY